VFLILLAILIVPAAVVVWFALVQFNATLNDLTSPPEMASESLLVPLEADPELAYRAALEHDTIVQRHARVAGMLASKAWIQFLTLILGAVLVFIGGAFVLGRITTAKSTAEINFEKIGASFASNSPGLVLCFLGVILIAIPNFAKRKVTFNDAAVYLGAGYGRVKHGDLDIDEARRAAVIEAIKAEAASDEGNDLEGPADEE
jgi:hypothetical protein